MIPPPVLVDQFLRGMLTQYSLQQLYGPSWRTLGPKYLTVAPGWRSPVFRDLSPYTVSGGRAFESASDEDGAALAVLVDVYGGRQGSGLPPDAGRVCGVCRLILAARLSGSVPDGDEAWRMVIARKGYYPGEPPMSRDKWPTGLLVAYGLWQQRTARYR